MITPSQPIEIPATVADGVWITNLIISAPSANLPVRVVANMAPFVSSTQGIMTDRQKTLVIPDLYAVAASDPAVANAVQALYAALQGQMQAQGLF